MFGLLRLLFGLIADLIAEAVFVIRASFGIFPTSVEILLVGGFLYFILSRYWWKKETPPAPQPEVKPDIPPSSDGKIRPL